MTAKEYLEIINKQWCDVNDIQKLAQCSKKRAFVIKRTILNKLLEKGYLIPAHYIPTVNVVEYLKIDVKFLESRALCEEKLKGK